MIANARERRDLTPQPPLRAGEREQARKSNVVRVASGLLPTVGLLAAVVLAWELAVRAMHVPVYLLPAPSAVGVRLASDPLFFAREGLVTLGEALGGLLIG